MLINLYINAYICILQQKSYHGHAFYTHEEKLTRKFRYTEILALLFLDDVASLVQR